MDQSAVGVDDLERLRLSHAATVVSLTLKPDAPGDPQRKPSLLRSTEPKGLFDALDNDLPQDDRKSALAVPIIAEFMRRAMCRPRWCPHDRKAADAMTKFKEAHSEPLFRL